MTQGEPVEIRARIRSLGTAPVDALAEFEVDGVKKGEKTDRDAGGQGEQEVVFTTSTRLEDGEVHVGKVKLGGSPDPFERDDERFFVFKVRPPMKVLLISDIPYEAEFVAAALDPEGPGVARRYLVERILTKEFGQKKNDLRAYACVFLLNVSKPRRGRLGSAQSIRSRGGRAGGRPRPAQQAGKLQQFDRRPSSCLRSSAKRPR